MYVTLIMQRICLSVCYSHFSRIVHLIYFTLGRFVAENEVCSGIWCSLDICQYEYILNKASTPPAQQQIGLQLSGFSLLQTEAGLTRDLVGKQT